MARRIFMDEDESSRSNPATLTRPDVFFSRVLSILMVVLFPAPLGPRKPKNSPRPTEKSNSRKGFHIARIDLDQVLDLDDIFDVHCLCQTLHVSVRLAHTSYQIIAYPSRSGIKE